MLEELTNRVLGVETVQRHLVASGLEAKLVPHGEASAIALTGRAVERVVLKLAASGWASSGSSSAVRVGNVPIYLSRTFPIQMHWIVPVDPAGAVADFTARLKLHRGGLFWSGEVDRAEWVGGALARKLGKSARTVGLACGLEARDGIEVRADADRRCVRIVHQTRATARFALLSPEILDVDRRLPNQLLLDGIEFVAKTIRELDRRA
jgi:hypothetical protein